MVVFLDLSGSKADLIAVRAVALGSFQSNLSLRELAWQCIGKRSSRVACAGDSHSLIYIGTAGKRIAAGSCAAEWFDFGRMVVRFILEEEQPVFDSCFCLDFHFDGACIDFLGLIEVFQLAFLAERFDSSRCHIHQCDRTLGVLAVNGDACFFIFIKSAFDRSREFAFFHADIGQACGECRMTAVIGPVRIEYADFSDSRISLFFITEVVTDHDEIVMAHGKSHGCDEFVKALVVEACQPFNGRNRFRIFNRQIERLGWFKACFPGFDRVHEELHDLFTVAFNEIAIECINERAAYACAVFAGNDGKALFSGICSLVILAWQEFYADDKVSLRERFLYGIDRRFREDSCDSLFIILFSQPVHIVAVVHSGFRKAVSQYFIQLGSEAFLTLAESFFLAYI